MHPYTLFLEKFYCLKVRFKNGVWGCILSVYYPYYILVCILFGPAISTYLFNFYSFFILVNNVMGRVITPNANCIPQKHLQGGTCLHE